MAVRGLQICQAVTTLWQLCAEYELVLLIPPLAFRVSPHNGLVILLSLGLLTSRVFHHSPPTMVSKSPVAAAEVWANQKNRTLNRRQIESLISAGHSIVIVDDKVLKVDSWLPFHPGGDKAIQHMVGRDATDEVHRYVYTL